MSPLTVNENPLTVIMNSAMETARLTATARLVQHAGYGTGHGRGVPRVVVHGGMAGSCIPVIAWSVHPCHRLVRASLSSSLLVMDLTVTARHGSDRHCSSWPQNVRHGLRMSVMASEWSLMPVRMVVNARQNGR